MPPGSDATPEIGAAPSKSWLYFLLGTSTLACLGLLTAILFIQFLQKRPTDLRGHTAYYDEVIAAALKDSYIPEANIRRGEPEPRDENNVLWSFVRFEVEVPPQFSADGLRDLCSDALINQGLNVVETPAEGSVRRFSVSYGQYEFASVALMPSAPDAARLNMRAASYEIARLTDEALSASGVPRDAITRMPAEDQEDAQALWALTRFTVIIPETLTAETLKTNLESRLTERNVQVLVSENPASAAQPGCLIQISADNKICVEITGIYSAPADTPNEGKAEQAPPAPETSEAEEEKPAETPPAPEPSPSVDGEKTAEGVIQLPPLEDLPLESTDHQSAENGQAPLPPSPEQRPRLAIILDDGGYGAPESEEALTLDSGVTLSILPNTPYAGEIAALGEEKGFEILLHMPMETARKNGKKAFPGEIGLKMSDEEIIRATQEALAQVPEAVGVNNHTGGLFTTDADKMTVFLNVLKEDNLFFVDSRTIAASKAYETAKSLGLKTAFRNVFLDNEKDPEKIRKQLAELVAKAKLKGQAIGIGHFRPDTITVLAEELPKLADSGVDLVHVSELVQ